MESSRELNEVLTVAHQVMRRCNASALDVDHIAIGLLIASQSVQRILAACRISASEAAEYIARHMVSRAPGAAPVTDRVQTTAQASLALSLAEQEAKRLGAPRTAPEHVLLALFNVGESLAVRILKRAGLTEDDVRRAITMIASQQDETAASVAEASAILDRFTVDLTELARAGRLDPLVGREKELEQVIASLGRRFKNNPALVGDPGVGKTAIVEGLAQCIADNRVPSYLAGRRVRALDWSALNAGTALRGSFEERLDAIVKSAAQEGCILFLDEMHLLLASGAALGGMNAANLLKPALARGDVRVIGATTSDEYRRHVESDPALERRFTPVYVGELSHDAVWQVLCAVRPRYEGHHGVTITDEALKAAITLGARFLPSRRMPDNALDVLDEACAYRRAQRDASTNSASHWEAEERAALERGDYERAAFARAQAIRSAHAPSEAPPAPQITRHDIAAVLTRRTNVPIGQILERDRERLIRLESRLRQRICGQDHAIAALVDAILRMRSGVRDDQRPISFLFVGPPGVGKTETARALAHALFGDESALLRLDMTEFQEPHSIARLIGSPPGYVGYDDASPVIERIRRNPFQVLLLDEMDKAHPAVARVLLQALGDGRLTDNHGRTVSLRNAVVIMTSNAGAEAMMDASFGLVAERRDPRPPSAANDAASRRVRQALRDVFPPEFIDRIDAVIPFHPLDVETLQTIVRRRLQDMTQRIQDEHGVTVVVDDALAPFVVHASGASGASGARTPLRALQDLIEPALARALIHRSDDDACLVMTVDAERGVRAEWRHATDQPSSPETTQSPSSSPDAASTMDSAATPAAPRARRPKRRA